jgi:3D (Asp-Asp-Asp) domain-containing protein
MLISRSFTRKLVVTCGAALGFILLHEAHTHDSRNAERQAEQRRLTAKPAPGLRLRFAATAYCKGETTASGATVRRGIAAADPSLIPVGSVIYVDSTGTRYDGIYTVMDTGPAVLGRQIDLYVWSCNEARAFGRRNVALTVLRLGWHPGASDVSGAPSANSAFRKRESAAAPAAPDETPPAGTGPASAPGEARPPGAGTTDPGDAPPAAEPGGAGPAPAVPVEPSPEGTPPPSPAVPWSR